MNFWEAWLYALAIAAAGCVLVGVCALAIYGLYAILGAWGILAGVILIWTLVMAAVISQVD